MVACRFEFSNGEDRWRLVISKLYMNFVGRFCQNGDAGRWQLATGLVEKGEIRANKRKRLAGPHSCIYVQWYAREGDPFGELGLGVFTDLRACEDSE